jgi:hypothetical protein
VLQPSWWWSRAPGHTEDRRWGPQPKALPNQGQGSGVRERGTPPNPPRNHRKTQRKTRVALHWPRGTEEETQRWRAVNGESKSREHVRSKNWEWLGDKESGQTWDKRLRALKTESLICLTINWIKRLKEKQTLDRMQWKAGQHETDIEPKCYFWQLSCVPFQTSVCWFNLTEDDTPEV